VTHPKAWSPARPSRQLPFVRQGSINCLNRALNTDEKFPLLGVPTIVLFSQNLCDIAPVFKLSAARRNQRPNVLVFLSQDRLPRQIEP
jgi:hypothetical protein